MFPGETVLSQRAMGVPADPHVSEFQVMRSPGNGLYYIGTVHISCGNECPECAEEGLPKGYPQPNSRETDYMEEKEAEEALRVFNLSGKLERARTTEFTGG